MNQRSDDLKRLAEAREDGMSTTEEQKIKDALYALWRAGRDGDDRYLAIADTMPLLSQHTQRARVIEISTRDTCDYCKEPMKYAGSNDGVKVVRSCAKHIELAKNHLAQLSTKDSTNKEEA